MCINAIKSVRSVREPVRRASGGIQLSSTELGSSAARASVPAEHARPRVAGTRQSILTLRCPGSCLSPRVPGHTRVSARLQLPSRQANCGYCGGQPGPPDNVGFSLSVHWVRLSPYKLQYVKEILRSPVPEANSQLVWRGRLSYRITIDGKEYTIHLVQKTFLPHNFRVYSYNGTQSMTPLEQNFQNFCYYQGHIEDHPKSMVIFSTCAGLRGLLQFENVSYGIEPLEPSIGFEHVIYQVKHKNVGLSLYAEEDIESTKFPYKTKPIKAMKQLSHYIEMHIVVEKYLYSHMGSDVAVVTEKIFQLVGIMNAIFTSFNLTIMLSSVELWIDENKIPVGGDANELMHRFLKWKKSYLVLRPHDVAFLLVYREKPDYIGATFEGKICDGQYGGGVALHPKSLSLESLAVILAQLLSLNMGIAYDDIKKCHCPGPVCIMNPDAIHSSGMKTFSNCSMEDLAHFISMPKSNCLRNQPRLGPLYLDSTPVCGNGRKEEGEECDCGTPEECASIVENCCDGTTCRKKDGTDCASGLCCSSCQFSRETCRLADARCDIKEVCNGTHADCPEDIYYYDGRPCGIANNWICFHGQCINGDEQCESIFQGSQFGSNECFNHLNSVGDIAGSCGLNNEEYKKCTSSNTKCGRLVCSTPKRNIFHISQASVFYTNISGNICLSLEYEEIMLDKSHSWIREGTACDTNKHCSNKECKDNAELGYSQCQENCTNQNMICNNKKQCMPVQNVSSQPVLYEIMSPSGEGMMKNIYHSTQKALKWPLFLFIPFLILLIVLTASVVKVHGQRKKQKIEEYTSTEKVESENESKV
ncbi:disintegrin and metalloproteinase domain-containing protein 2 [Sorex araneus]|uniref:disintegrin and metalloproteinase domain-containing protein 2 n=1 Tax=Sorex araneus TaxID=42254 RepID=UPI002433462B|nr:disintegrin and metalloproteinase domain-containing protein 2 [Sorex araneus]